MGVQRDLLCHRTERGQTIAFAPYGFLIVFMFMAGGIIVGRIIVANAVIQAAADAAALAAAAEVDVPHFRETGEVRYMPSAYGEAQRFANMNAGFLLSHGIPVSVERIWVSDNQQRTYATVSANIESLLPSFIPYSGSRSMTGIAVTRVDTGP